MKFFTCIFVVLLLFVGGYGQMSVEWTVLAHDQYPWTDPVQQIESARSIVPTDNGGTLVLGFMVHDAPDPYSWKTFRLGYITEINKDGNQIAEKHYYSPHDTQYPIPIVTKAVQFKMGFKLGDYYLMAGVHNGSYGWVVKLDSSYNVVWEKSYSKTYSPVGNLELFESLSLDSDGNYIGSTYYGEVYKMNSQNGDLQFVSSTGPVLTRNIISTDTSYIFYNRSSTSFTESDKNGNFLFEYQFDHPIVKLNSSFSIVAGNVAGSYSPTGKGFTLKTQDGGFLVTYQKSAEYPNYYYTGDSHAIYKIDKNSVAAVGSVPLYVGGQLSSIAYHDDGTITGYGEDGGYKYVSKVLTGEIITPPCNTCVVSVTPDFLWPPNHNMVPITVSLNPECDVESIVLDSVVSNEPDNGQGDGNTVNDVQGVSAGIADFEFEVRAERCGNGSGRTYTAHYSYCGGEVIAEINIPLQEHSCPLCAPLEKSIGSFNGSMVPDEFFVSPNYPNPFNPTTSIEFGLPEASVVRIFVYDLLGQKMATLVDGHLEAGVHSVMFEASHLPSGVYFYSVESGDYRNMYKMILLK
jgi:hypothetical protein